MTEPTQEQIKEFWEWCGFKYIPFKHLGTRKDKSVLYPKGVTVISTQQEHWEYPDGSKQTVAPDIDLNNLFRYAVPSSKFPCFTLSYGYYLSGYIFRARVCNAQNIWRGAEHKTDPALALFWALWEAKEAIK